MSGYIDPNQPVEGTRVVVAQPTPESIGGYLLQQLSATCQRIALLEGRLALLEARLGQDL